MTLDELRDVQKAAWHYAEAQRKELQVYLDNSIDIVPHKGVYDLDVRTFEGKLGHITFTHYNYYYIATGRVPLDTANELYAHPLGKRAIRVAGHCGCPPPHEWSRRIAPDGREIVGNEVKKELGILGGSMAGKDWDKEYLFSDISIEGEKSYIGHYHIDGDAALMLYVNTLRKNWVVP